MQSEIQGQPDDEDNVTFCIKKMSKKWLPNILKVGAIQNVVM